MGLGHCAPLKPPSSDGVLKLRSIEIGSAPWEKKCRARAEEARRALPVQGMMGFMTAHGQARATNGKNMEKAVVLVVEDEALIRMNAVCMMEDAGFAVVEACNADEAIRILESRDDIRAVFTDINMSGSMDGWKLAHAVRGRWPPIHVIITSGSGVLDRGQLPANGRFIRKPYTGAQVTAALLELFGHSPAPGPAMNDNGHNYGKVA
jgi:two-component system, response regulator PdtaR